MDGSLAYLAGAAVEGNIQEAIRAQEQGAHADEMAHLHAQWAASYRELADTHNTLVAEYNKLLEVLASSRQELQEVNKKLHFLRANREAVNCAGRLSMKEARDLQSAGFSELFDSLEQACGIQLDSAWREQAVAKVSAAYPLIFDYSDVIDLKSQLRDELIKYQADKPLFKEKGISQKIAEVDAIAEPIYREFKKSRQS